MQTIPHFFISNNVQMLYVFAANNVSWLQKKA